MAVELAAEKLITYAVIITEATTAHVRRRSWRQQTVVVFINSLPSLCYYALGSADDDFWDQDHDDVTIELRIESKKSRYSKYIKLLLDDWANQNIPVSVQICVHNDGYDDDSDDTYLASWLCVEVNTTSWFLAAGLRTCQLLLRLRICLQRKRKFAKSGRILPYFSEQQSDCREYVATQSAQLPVHFTKLTIWKVQSRSASLFWSASATTTNSSDLPDLDMAFLST